MTASENGDEAVVAAALLPDARTTSYSKALHDGVVELQRCGSCGRSQAPPLPFCRNCGSDALTAVAAAGRGTVVSATRVEHRFHAVSPPPPYVVAMVELVEGPRLYGLMDPDTP